MEGLTAISLFDLALVVPPLAVVVGILLLLLPSRTRRASTSALPAQAA